MASDDIFDCFYDNADEQETNFTDNKKRIFVGEEPRKKLKRSKETKNLKPVHEEGSACGSLESGETKKNLLKSLKRNDTEIQNSDLSVLFVEEASSMETIAQSGSDISSDINNQDEDVSCVNKGDGAITSDPPVDVNLDDIDDVMKYLDAYLDKSRIRIETVSSNGCLHDIALPPAFEYTPPKELNLNFVREYPFELDPFQKEAISCINSNESVLVSAHTSSGKTVVAEHSIALALRNHQRVIYTTPIKALSNQKYREFEAMFQDVGLVTGDVTLNFEASCLIMTTEILRNMLYRGSEIMREVAWIIFDEIHYMRDKERGVVWEETLILLPDNIHSVFLSATIPNAGQFAEWVAYLHNQPCHVIYTDTRPVPLEHHLYPAGDSTLHLVVDEFGNFREESFNRAMECIKTNVSGKISRGGRMSQDMGLKCCELIQLLINNNFTPMIIFSFSKKECEFYATLMARQYKSSNDVREAVTKIFDSAISCLSDDDKVLPQVTTLLTLLQKGIGIHHSGLLPILKEVVEILFAEGLINTLFATETFAMGLNMPARTVMFTGCRKFDGREMRLITSGEYIQMSGRAGRRGLDEKGTAIIMVTEALTPEDVKQVTKGQADHLNSAFHLTYNMILNLLRVEGINPEYMLEKSFHQFQNQGNIPNLFEKIRQLEEIYNQICIPNEEQVANYYQLRKNLKDLSGKFRSFIFHHETVIGFLQAGRLVKIQKDSKVSDWCMVLNFRRKSDPKEGGYIDVDVLICHQTPTDGTQLPQMEIITVKNNQLFEISSIKINYPKDLRPNDNKVKVYNLIQEVKIRFEQNLPLLNPKNDMNITASGFNDIIKSVECYESELYKHPLVNSPEIDELYKDYCRKIDIEEEIDKLKTDLKQQISSIFLHELRCRKRVLRRMNYCTSADVILQKGRVACELSSGQELLLTELIFNGTFNELTVPQTVALLSCLLCDEKSKQMPKITTELNAPLRKMQELARKISQVSIESRIDMDEEEYIASLKPYLMDACYAWSSGATFIEVCKSTDIFEGSIIRCLRRMEEMLRQLIQAAKGIGNEELEIKFTECVNSIKRDIVFAPSLYL